MTMPSFWCLYCELGTNFTHCSAFFFVDFEQVNAGWVMVKINRGFFDKFSKIFASHCITGYNIRITFFLFCDFI